MHSFVPHPWNHEERTLFVAITQMVAALTGRLVADERVRLAREDAIRALGLALEYRDAETKGHTDRVTQLAIAIAAQLQLDARTTESQRQMRSCTISAKSQRQMRSCTNQASSIQTSGR